MYEEYTQNRIAQLRTQRKVSAREMSLSLGQNDTYINKIENHKALPSLQGLFYICDYLRITPQEFFDEGMENPMVLKEVFADLKRLDGDALSSVASVVKELLRKK